MVALAILAGGISGLTAAALIASIQETLSHAGVPAQFFGLLALLFAGRILSELLLLGLAQRAAERMRLQLVRSILAAPLRTLEQVGAPRLLSALTEDIGVISNALGYIPILCINGTVVLGCLIYLGFLSVSTLIWILGFLVAGICVYQVAIWAAFRFLNRARTYQDSLFQHFRAVTDGVKELKLNRRRREAFVQDLLSDTLRRFRRDMTTGMGIYSTAGTWGEVLFFLVIASLLWPLSWMHAPGPESRSAFVLTTVYLMAPLGSILSTFPAIGRAQVALKNVQDLGLSLGPPAMADAAAPGTKDHLQVELQGVTHTYWREGESQGFSLGPLHVNFVEGEIVLLIGGNGSGKTTLLKLLMGLYTPEAGQILWNGTPVIAENLLAYRESFSAVYSDFFLFDQLLGMEHPSIDDRARELLRLLQLDQQVQVHAGTLSTTAVSQGQRKRLALLVAYLEDRPFYVFDEWAADQDPVFKDVFYYELLPGLRRKGKAVVAVTHDDRYFGVADRLIKLEYGNIVEDRKQVSSMRRMPA